MFRLFLSAYGYNVVCAENGPRGLELVREYQPQIVFTDLKMPEMDGIEVLKKIKELAPQTEVIVITGHGDMDLAMQALNLDASDFINKPIDRVALEAALERAQLRLANPMANTCRLTFETRNQVSLIRIEGTLTGKQEACLSKLVDKARQAGSKDLLLAFSANAAVNGAGIGVLSRLVGRDSSRPLSVAVSGLSINFILLLKMVGLNRFMALYESEQEALASIQGR